MKKILTTTLFIFLSFAFCKAQYVTIPDAHFVAWLNSHGFSGCMNGNQMDTTCSAIVNATFISISDTTITNATGLEYFDNLNSFQWVNTKVTSFNRFPKNATSIQCWGNKLTSLPTLPVWLESLYCDDNQLTSLPTLPTAFFHYLDCYDNKLTSLPLLPGTLQSLNCSNNQFTSLPDLPAKLYDLRCSFNQLTYLPNLPSTIYSLYCNDNPGLSCMPGLPASMINLQFQNTGITCISNKPSVYYPTNPLLSSVPYCSCPDAPYFSISDISNEKAKIGWFPDLYSCNKEYGYQIQYRPNGSNSWKNTFTRFPIDSNILTDLIGSTKYEVQMRGVCDSANSIYSNWSASEYFTTLSVISDTSIQFSGNDDYVEFDQGISSFGTGDFTIEAWIKDENPAPYGTNEVILSNVNNDLDEGFGLYLNDGYPYLQLNNHIYSISGTNLRDNTCHHIAVVRKDSVIYCYIDKQAGEIVRTGYNDSVVSHFILYFGRDGFPLQYYEDPFQGLIKEVRIWTSARTQKEIIDNMNTAISINGNYTLVDYWRCNEGSDIYVSNYGYDGSYGIGNFSWTNGCGPCVNPGPVTISATPGKTICQGVTDVLSAGVGYSSYIWSTGATTQSISVSAAGNYLVTVTTPCETYSSSIAITVNPTPAMPGAIIESGGNARVCPGDVRTYSVPAVAGITYNWVIPAGANTTGSFPTNKISLLFTSLFTSSGNLSVAAGNGLCTSAARTLAISRNVPAQPSIIVETAGSAKVCPGDVRTYRVTLVNGVTYNWAAFKGANITSGQGTNSIIITFTDSFTATSGVLSVTASYGNTCGASAARTLTIYRNNPGQPSTITVTGGITKVCPGEVRTCSVTNVSGITYNWVAPTGINITSGQGTNSINISVTSGFTATSGILSVTASYGNTCGISAPRTTTIYRNNPAQPSTIAVTGGATKICPGDARTCSVTLVSSVTYNWILFTGDSLTAGQGTNSINMAITKAFTATTGSLSVTANNACGASSARAVTFTKNSPTEPGVITGTTSVCANSTQPYSITAVANATSYVWGVPTGSVIQSGQGTTGISNKFGITAGNVAVKSTNGCGASAVRTLAVAITCREDGEEILPASDFTIYPNPVSWQLTVSSLQLAGSKLIVTDMLGRVYLDEKIADEVNSKTLDVSNLASGVYFVTLKTEKGSTVRKFVKE